MITVRAKFKVTEIKRHHYGDKEMQTICMSPVYSGDEGSENRKFWDATPDGSLELGCINLAAARRFDLGAEYYLDFTPVAPEEAEETGD